MFYEIRTVPDKEKRTTVQVVCTEPSAFDHVVAEVGSLALVKFCMAEGTLAIHSMNPETQEYITTKLSTDDKTTKGLACPSSKAADL